MGGVRRRTLGKTCNEFLEFLCNIFGGSVNC